MTRMTVREDVAGAYTAEGVVAPVPVGAPSAARERV